MLFCLILVVKNPIPFGGGPGGIRTPDFLVSPSNAKAEARCLIQARPRAHIIYIPTTFVLFHTTLNVAFRTKPKVTSDK